MCIVSRQCDEYSQEQMILDAFDDAINNRVSHLLDGDFNPKKHENIMSALGELTNDQEQILVTMINHSACTLSVMLKGWISDYWEDAAEHQAIKELSK